MAYKVNPITGELDTFGYTPDAQPGLQAENGWAQQVPPEILAKLLAQGQGSITDPATGMTYHVAQGQGGSGAQYVFAEDGHTGPGRKFPQYDLGGNYMGAATGASPTSPLVPLLAAGAMYLGGAGLGGLGGSGEAAGAAADGGWGLTNAVVNGGAGTDLAGLSAAGTGATVLPAAAAGSGLLDKVGTALGGAKGLLGPLATIGGALAGSQGVKNTENSVKSMDPRMDSLFYGDLAPRIQGLLAQQMSPQGQAGWQQIQNAGMGLLANPVAGNGFNKFFPGR